ncbi:MAG: hypothetical protein KAS66_13565 [Candidatus Omnitrophica bacterium]|nr:hypothetical protein [Candidatus Omnitrophota bacterium]
MSGKKPIEYIVIELNVLRSDYIRHDATFMEKVTAKSQEEAVQIVRDLNEYTVTLGDLIAVPTSQFKMYSRYTDEVKVWED